MSRPLYLDHNFTNKQYQELRALDIDVFSPPDWLNPVNFLVRGTVAEPHYINSQFEEAADDERLFVTTDYRVVENVTKLREQGDDEAIASNVLVIDESIYKAFTGEDIQALIDEELPFASGQLVYADSKGIVNMSNHSAIEGKDFVEAKGEEKLAEYIKQATDNDTATESDDSKEKGRDEAELADDYDQQEQEYDLYDPALDERQEEIAFDEQEPEQVEHSL